MQVASALAAALLLYGSRRGARTARPAPRRPSHCFRTSCSLLKPSLLFRVPSSSAVRMEFGREVLRWLDASRLAQGEKVRCNFCFSQLCLWKQSAMADGNLGSQVPLTNEEKTCVMGKTRTFLKVAFQRLRQAWRTPCLRAAQFKNVTKLSSLRQCQREIVVNRRVVHLKAPKRVEKREFPNTLYQKWRPRGDNHNVGILGKRNTYLSFQGIPTL